MSEKGSNLDSIKDKPPSPPAQPEPVKEVQMICPVCTGSGTISPGEYKELVKIMFGE